MKSIFIVLVSSILLISTSQVFAEEERVTFNAFFTTGIIQSDSDIPYDNQGDMGGESINKSVNHTYYSRMGIQFNYKINEDVDITGQFVGRNRSKDYQLKTEMAYFSYRLNDSIRVRGGRLRVPMFHFSETIEVSYTYPWLKPPIEVYQIRFFEGYSGMDMIGNFEIGEEYTLGVQAFGGTSKNEMSDTVSSGFTQQISITNMKGLNLTLNREELMFRTVWMNGVISSNVKPEGKDEVKYLYDLDTTYLAFSVQYDTEDIFFVAEASRIHSKNGKKSLKAPLASDYEHVSNSWFATLGYRITDTLMPHITYSSVAEETKEENIPNFPTTDSKVTSILQQNSTILGIRKDLALGVSLKAELHRIHVPEKSKDLAANVGFFDKRPDRDVNLYALGMDFVF